MNKRALAELGRVFGYEVDGKIAPVRDNATVRKLVETGHLSRDWLEIGGDGFPPMKIMGLALTDKGRMAWCEHCGAADGIKA